MESLRISKYFESLYEDSETVEKEKDDEDTAPVTVDIVRKPFWDFTTSPPFVTLVVEEKDLHVHRDILTAASPVFSDMLNSDDCLEKKSGKINLPGKKLDDIQEMLNLLYPFNCQVVDSIKLKVLLNLSQEYKIQVIKDKCEKFLLTKECSEDLLLVAQQYGLKKLLKKCIKFFGNQPLFNVDDDKDITKENITAIKLEQLVLLQSEYVTLKDVTLPINYRISCSNKNVPAYDYKDENLKPQNACNCNNCHIARCLHYVRKQKKIL